MHMTGEAKRAARMEKKLKVLTGGYQVGDLIFSTKDTYFKICTYN